MAMLGRLALVAVAFLPLTACGLSWPAVSGRILEEGTGKPIPGAIVLVRWEGYVSAPGHGHQVCVHVMSATTNDQGHYYLEAWNKGSKMGPVSRLHTTVVPYKTGYQYPRQPSQESGTHYLALASGTEDERAAFLLRVLGNAQCYTKDASEKNRLPLLRALEHEAAALTPVRDKQTLVEAIQFEREIVQLGYEKAQTRHLERRKNAIR